MSLEFCIEILSNNENCYSGTRSGSPIILSRNNDDVDILETGFKDFRYCWPLGQVNSETDIFGLEIQGGDGVSNFDRNASYN